MRELKSRQEIRMSPHLLVLVSFIIGEGAEGAYRDALVSRAIVNARHGVSGIAPRTAFNNGEDFCTYLEISNVVDHALAALEEDGARRRSLLQALNHTGGDELGPVPASDVYDLLNNYADAGMVFGAALMYELLKGPTD